MDGGSTPPMSTSQILFSFDENTYFEYNGNLIIVLPNMNFYVKTSEKPTGFHGAKWNRKKLSGNIDPAERSISPE